MKYVAAIEISFFCNRKKIAKSFSWMELFNMWFERKGFGKRDDPDYTEKLKRIIDSIKLISVTVIFSGNSCDFERALCV